MQFWIIALLSLYSMISQDFPLAASFSNAVNTMEKIRISRKEGGFPVLDTDILNTVCLFFSLFCQLLK